MFLLECSIKNPCMHLSLLGDNLVIEVLVDVVYSPLPSQVNVILRFRSCLVYYWFPENFMKEAYLVI